MNREKFFERKHTLLEILEKQDILQNEMQSLFGISSTQTSILSRRLEESGFVTREKIKIAIEGVGFRTTYKISLRKVENYSTDCSENISIENLEGYPCLKCEPYKACEENPKYEPLTCPLLSEWVLKSYRQKS